jgi:ribosomal protein S18 acetylase RimI-like enzyme
MLSVDFASSYDIQFIKERGILSDKQIDYKINNTEILIAYDKDNSIGILILDKLWNHIPFISYIFVIEKYRRQGVGKSLLMKLEKNLIDNKQTILFSSSMENANKAQQWHIKMGFIDSGIIHNINKNGIGEIFFRKELKN